MGGVRKVWEQGIENNFLQEGRTKYKISWDEKTRKLAVNAVQQLQGLAAVA